eukprot:354955-Chlamydomonas_euryale.AAC.3
MRARLHLHLHLHACTCTPAPAHLHLHACTCMPAPEPASESAVCHPGKQSPQSPPAQHLSPARLTVSAQRCRTRTCAGVQTACCARACCREPELAPVCACRTCRGMCLAALRRSRGRSTRASMALVRRPCSRLGGQSVQAGRMVQARWAVGAGWASAWVVLAGRAGGVGGQAVPFGVRCLRGSGAGGRVLQIGRLGVNALQAGHVPVCCCRPRRCAVGSFVGRARKMSTLMRQKSR